MKKKKEEVMHLNQKKYLIGIILIGLVAFSFLNGCTGFAITCEDQSRQKLNNCNIDCGEGILSELCKTKCTAEHNDRMDKCAGN